MVTSVVAILPQRLGVGQTVAIQTDLQLLLAMDQDGGDPSQSQPAGMDNLTDGASTIATLAVIDASKTTLMGRIDALAIECGLIRQDLDKFRGQLTTADSHISDIEVTAVTINHNVAEHSKALDGTF